MKVGSILSLIPLVKTVQATQTRVDSSKCVSDTFITTEEEQKRQERLNEILSVKKFNVNDYFALSKEDKKLVRNNCSYVYKYAADRNVRVGLNVKKLLDEEYGKDNYVFVCIGTSPSCIGRVMEFSGVETKYLPISGLRSNLRLMNFMEDKSRLEQYREFLEEQGISKEKIKNSGKKYLFFDYTFTGTSLTAFRVLMEQSFGISLKNIEYKSIDNTISEVTINDFGEIDVNKVYLNEFLRNGKSARYCGIDHYNVDSSDLKETLKYEDDNAKRFNFLVMELLEEKGLLRYNPANEKSL